MTVLLLRREPVAFVAEAKAEDEEPESSAEVAVGPKIHGRRFSHEIPAFSQTRGGAEAPRLRSERSQLESRNFHTGSDSINFLVVYPFH